MKLRAPDWRLATGVSQSNDVLLVSRCGYLALDETIPQKHEPWDKELARDT